MIAREYEVREKLTTVGLSVHVALESAFTLLWKP